MNKIWALTSALVLLSCLGGCGGQSVTSLRFAKSEYTITSGESVTVENAPSGVSYSFIENVANVGLDSSRGIISYTADVPNGTQMLYQASYQTIKSDVVVVSLLSNAGTPKVAFTNLTSNLCDGDEVFANATHNYAIEYSLTSPAKGITIEKSSGIVHFTEAVSEGETFNVTASAHGVSASQDFTAVVSAFVTSKTKRQVAENGKEHPVAYYLDFSAAPRTTSTALLGVSENGKALALTSYSYDEASQEVILQPAYLKNLSVGEHTLKLVTSRNNVTVPLLVVTKFIATPEDLASINDSAASLNGYYVQTADIDLTSYLAQGGKGYNDGQLWKPIGLYHDVSDGTAYNDSFKGTYDGTGHVIKGLAMVRSDETAYNAGLFGCVYSTATITNLGVISASPLSFRSYSGGFVGANAGIIKNCFAQVDVSAHLDGSTLKVNGGFVGRNEGTISSCISYGKAEGDTLVGAFAGSNLGTLSHCYAIASSGATTFLGEGTLPETNLLFSSLADLTGHDFSESLSGDDWTLATGKAPALKNTLELYFVLGISLVNLSANYTRGDKIALSVAINPSNLQSSYESQVVYSVLGAGYSLSAGVIDTTNASDLDFTISASLTLLGETYSDSFSAHLYDKVESITIDKSTTVFDAGHAYQLKASVTPTTACQDVIWSLTAPVDGVSIKGDVLTISEICQKTACRILCKAGNSSALFIASIRPLLYVNNAPIVLHRGQIRDLHFVLPSGIDLNGCSVNSGGVNVPFEIQGEEVVVSSDTLSGKPSQMVAYNIVLASGSSYRGLAAYIDHAFYDESYVKTTYSQVITLGSVGDFATYFNLRNYDESRFANYAADKVYLLTADIDFASERLYGIGSESHPFLATIYGNGHTLSNYGSGTSTSMDNETYFTLDASSQVSAYRSSLYLVGFFSVFGGKCYDLHFDKMAIKGNNYVGGFAGEILSGAEIENVQITSSHIINIDEVDHSVSSDDHVAGFACLCQGKLVAVSVNGSTLNLTPNDF